MKRCLVVFVACALATVPLAGRVDARGGHSAFQTDCSTDADGDGVADGFTGMKGVFRLTPHAGGRCQEAQAPTGPPRFAEVLRSHAVDVKPRSRYSVRFECKGRGLSIFHVKFRWLDSKGRTVKTVAGKNYEQMLSPAKRTPTGSWWDAAKAGDWLPALERNGDWDWETWQGYYVAPPSVTRATIEFWAERKGGTFWVDNVVVREVVKSQFKPKRVMLNAPSSESAPRREGNALVLSGPVRIELMFAEDGAFLGLGKMTVRGVVVRAGAMPLAPLLFGKASLGYRRCELVSVERTKRGFTLHTALVAPDGSRDNLDWEISLLRARAGDALGVGVALRFVFASQRREAREVMVRAGWCLGDGVDGLKVVQQFPVPKNISSQVVQLTKQSCVRLALRLRIGAGDWMTFLSAANASLVVFPCGLDLAKYRLARVPPMNELIHEERFTFPLSKRVSTPPLYVVLLDKGGPDAWTAAMDWTAERLRALAGVKEVEPMPIANFAGPFRVPPTHPLWNKLLLPDRGNWRWKTVCDWAAERAVPEAKRLGFKRIWITLWVSQATEWKKLTPAQQKKIRLASACGPLTLDVADIYGGIEGLRKLCRVARENGVEVVSWFALAHLSNISPLYLAHPDWALIAKDGKPFTFGYVDITGMWHPAGFGRYALEKLRAAREAGLRGLWLDSYPVFGAGRVNYGDPRLSPHIPHIISFQRQLEEMGYTMLDEGSSPIGLTSWGIGQKEVFDRYARAPWLLYKTSPYIPPKRFPWQKNCYLLPRGAYFRLLANKCCPILGSDQWRGRPDVEAEIHNANQAYVRVHGIMKRRHLLPDEQGVLWESEQGLVLFAFKTGRVDIGRRMTKALDAVRGGSVRFVTSQVDVQAMKVYEIRTEQ